MNVYSFKSLEVVYMAYERSSSKFEVWGFVKTTGNSALSGGFRNRSLLETLLVEGLAKNLTIKGPLLHGQLGLGKFLPVQNNCSPDPIYAQ